MTNKSSRWIFLLTGVRKLETSILRLYVINTIQTNKSEKLTEFFEKMAADLQSQIEWREWFSKSGRSLSSNVSCWVMNILAVVGGLQ